MYSDLAQAYTAAAEKTEKTMVNIHGEFYFWLAFCSTNLRVSGQEGWNEITGMATAAIKAQK
jgi:hypothetical protein